MTYNIDNDRIPATADATMKRILLEGFSPLFDNRRGVSGQSAGGKNKRPEAAKMRAQDAVLAEEIRGLFPLKTSNGNPVASIDNRGLATSTASSTAERSSNRRGVVRNVEVVTVKQIGNRRVSKSTTVAVVCKSRRKH